MQNALDIFQVCKKQKKKAFKNITRKELNPLNKHFLLFFFFSFSPLPTIFLLCAIDRFVPLIDCPALSMDPLLAQPLIDCAAPSVNGFGAGRQSCLPQTHRRIAQCDLLIDALTTDPLIAQHDRSVAQHDELHRSMAHIFI